MRRGTIFKKAVSMILCSTFVLTSIFQSEVHAEKKTEKHEYDIVEDSAEGSCKDGWEQYEGYWYYYYDGELQKECFWDGYWLDSDGACTSPYKAGWNGGAGNWWYGDDSGWYAKSCWLKIDGEYYYFDAKGMMCFNTYIGSCYLNDDGVYKDTENSRWAAGISAGELANYFRGAVIVGDSVCVGFEMYCSSSGDPVAQQFTFMANGSFGVNNALSFNNTTPTYMGEKRPIWDSIALSGTNHVYISMGVNDVGYSEMDVTYETLVDRIHQYVPNAEITICSITGVMVGGEKGHVSNAYVDWYNKKLRAMCARKGLGFIDLNSWVTDGTGLYSGYCSDGYVHQNPSAYARWLEAFKCYGRAELVKRYE